MKWKVVTLCSGYDSQCMALDEIKKVHPDFDYELVAWSEIDKAPIQMHDLIYPQWADRNLGDMTKIDWAPIKEKYGEIDLLTYSTPCQDISQAGLQAGFDEGADTRSAILWHTAKAIEILRPKYLLQENVKAIISGRPKLTEDMHFDLLDDETKQSEYERVLSLLPEGTHLNTTLEKAKADKKGIIHLSVLTADNKPFTVNTAWGNITKWMSRVESFGYKNDWAIINSKDQNVPQNRERFFLLSQREDVYSPYRFPKKKPLEYKLADVLEEEVDTKYFLKDESVGKFLTTNNKDKAVFTTFDIPPRHEDAMFLKTFLQEYMDKIDGWQKEPEELRKSIEEAKPLFLQLYEKWQELGDEGMDDSFRQMYFVNLGRKFFHNKL